MSAGSISLESAIRTCKVDTAYANKMESDRFLNPNNMVCPIWNGRDSAGRQVCQDSFVTKRAGCHSASDRVNVENDQRPQYSQYINLSAAGIEGDIYGNNFKQDLYDIHNVTGNFGKQFAANIYPSCGPHPYKDAMACQSKHRRELQGVNVGQCGNQMRCHSGF